MSTQSSPPLWLLLLIPVGFLLYISWQEETSPNPSKGKEIYYLRYNKDEIFKSLIASEGHFRNVADFAGIDKEGNMNCIVKHLADAEGHLDEAISHSVITGDNSQKFRALRNDVRDFRHELQDNHITAEEGIERTRKLRRLFENFNPDYDISKCEACEIALQSEEG